MIIFMFSTLYHLCQLVHADIECSPRKYGIDKIVCVCNTQICDTIDPIIKFDSNKFIQYTSSKDGLRLKRTDGEIVINKNYNSTPIEIKLNPDNEFQQILGWGGAFTDSFGINMKYLSEDVQEKLLRSYFADDGIEYSLCRVPIGGTDFSTHAYEYDEVPGDKLLEHFNLTFEDYEYKIPFIKKATKLNTNEKLRLFATAWSAPGWMKTSDKINGRGFLLHDLYQTWADYHMKFFDMYAQQGIEFWGVTTGNEPSVGLLPIDTINAMGWTPLTSSKWVSQHLKPTLNKSSHSNINIIALDDNRFVIPMWIDKMFKDPKTESAVNGIGIHWYGDFSAPYISLDALHEKYPNKFLLYTESCSKILASSDKVDLGDWNRGEKYLESIIDTGNEWVTGWIDWNMALDEQGGPNWMKNYVDAPIIINKTANEFYKQPMYYALAHVAKFIPPKSIRIDHEGQLPDKLKMYTLHRPDGHLVVIILNKHNEDYNLTLILPDNRNVMTAVIKSSFNTILI